MKLKEFLPYNYQIVSKVFNEEAKEEFYILVNKLKNNLEKIIYFKLSRIFRNISKSLY